MRGSEERNPDSDFVLHGEKKAIRFRQDDYLNNSQRTISTSNLEAQRHKQTGRFNPKHVTSPNILELERSINDLKTELLGLNRSLEENYGKSKIFLADDMASDAGVGDVSEEEDSDLHFLLQRQDQEAVSHLPDRNPSWFSDPQHKTRTIGDYPTYQSLGGTRRSVSPTNRSIGRFGVEISAKDVTGSLSASDLANDDPVFPVRLTAPHIVGVRSLLPPKHEVRLQNWDRSTSPQSRPVEPEILLSGSMRRMFGTGGVRSTPRDPSPLPVWMPTSKNPNASAQKPPAFNKRKERLQNQKRPSSAPTKGGKLQPQLTRPSSTKRYRPNKYKRPQVQPLPGATELSFMRSADQIDTRRALVENSPYQQQLAKLRLERLRVEEDYLLQLKRESELERIRGPKPKWYEMKGPEFHYECNKNTTLHKNYSHWGDTVSYRDHLLETSREFTDNMRPPVHAVE